MRNLHDECSIAFRASFLFFFLCWCQPDLRWLFHRGLGLLQILQEHNPVPGVSLAMPSAGETEVSLRRSYHHWRGLAASGAQRCRKATVAGLDRLQVQAGRELRKERFPE